MPRDEDFLRVIRERATQLILYLPNAARQMARPDRMITTGEVRAVVTQNEIIEDYPDDARGHSALMMGSGIGGRPLHIVCAPKDGFLAAITAYVPNPVEWSSDFRRRNES